jgi:23S rRNA pseudouridine2605 synthase
MAAERLQKILARAGIASRRAAEGLIQAGRVSVDGKVVTELGAKADLGRQRVALDGKLITPELPVYVVFHKPKGVVCTMQDPEGRETVADYMKQVSGRVVPVGRLDYHTSGVLLLTNDGEFSAKLLHPSSRVEKVYVAKARGVVGDAELEVWRQSIDIDGRATQPANVRRLRTEGDKTWLEITLHEGRNRQIHRIGEAAGSAIFRLARISFAGVTSEGLRPGQWRYLGKEELTSLKKAFGVPHKIVPAPPLPNASELRRQRADGVGRGERGAADGKPMRGRKKPVRRREAAEDVELEGASARTTGSRPVKARGRVAGAAVRGARTSDTGGARASGARGARTSDTGGARTSGARGARTDRMSVAAAGARTARTSAATGARKAATTRGQAPAPARGARKKARRSS